MKVAVVNIGDSGGPRAAREVVFARQISDENTVTCALLGDGSARCWKSKYQLVPLCLIHDDGTIGCMSREYAQNIAF